MPATRPAGPAPTMTTSTESDQSVIASLTRARLMLLGAVKQGCCGKGVGVAVAGAAESTPFAANDARMCSRGLPETALDERLVGGRARAEARKCALQRRDAVELRPCDAAVTAQRIRELQQAVPRVPAPTARRAQ